MENDDTGYGNSCLRSRTLGLAAELLLGVSSQRIQIMVRQWAWYHTSFGCPGRILPRLLPRTVTKWYAYLQLSDANAHDTGELLIMSY